MSSFDDDDTEKKESVASLFKRFKHRMSPRGRGIAARILAMPYTSLDQEDRALRAGVVEELRGYAEEARAEDAKDPEANARRARALDEQRDREQAEAHRQKMIAWFGTENPEPEPPLREDDEDEFMRPPKPITSFKLTPPKFGKKREPEPYKSPVFTYFDDPALTSTVAGEWRKHRHCHTAPTLLPARRRMAFLALCEADIKRHKGKKERAA
jgi:hypothetical protein